MHSVFNVRFENIRKVAENVEGEDGEEEGAEEYTW